MNGCDCWGPGSRLDTNFTAKYIWGKIKQIFIYKDVTDVIGLNSALMDGQNDAQDTIKTGKCSVRYRI
jgi:hypothetical protein